MPPMITTIQNPITVPTLSHTLIQINEDIHIKEVADAHRAAVEHLLAV